MAGALSWFMLTVRRGREQRPSTRKMRLWCTQTMRRACPCSVFIGWLKVNSKGEANVTRYTVYTPGEAIEYAVGTGGAVGAETGQNGA